jgi:hypothetical protein
LPPSNYGPNESPAKTHGRVAGRRAAVAAAESAATVRTRRLSVRSRSGWNKIRGNGFPRLLRQRAAASSRRLIGRDVEPRSPDTFYRSSSLRPAIFIRERSNPCFSG